MPTEAKYALEVAFDHAPVGMAVLDDELGFRMVNKAYCQLLSYPREELLGMSLPDIVHPEDQWLDQIWHEFIRDEATESFSREKRMVSREGETIWVNHSSRKSNLARESPLFTVNTVEPLVGERMELAERASREEWTARIKDALEDDSLVLHGQPIIDVTTGQVVQHELLLRMRREGSGNRLIMPREFMPPAEKYGLVNHIDHWVLLKSLEIARHMRVTVNLSGSTISRPELIEAIEQAVEAAALPPDHLVFEITETAVVDNLETAKSFIENLHRLGCRFALDDFGTGYGSFSYLKRLPVDYLKIDIEFVRDMLYSPSDRKVVKAIAATAELFGISTIAEGVEDADTLESLREYGIDFAQGFHIGRPAEIGG